MCHRIKPAPKDSQIISLSSPISLTPFTVGFLHAKRNSVCSFFLPRKVPITFLRFKGYEPIPLTTYFLILDSPFFLHISQFLLLQIQSGACPPIFLLLMCRQIRNINSLFWLLCSFGFSDCFLVLLFIQIVSQSQIAFWVFKILLSYYIITSKIGLILYYSLCSWIVLNSCYMFLFLGFW